MAEGESRSEIVSLLILASTSEPLRAAHAARSDVDTLSRQFPSRFQSRRANSPGDASYKENYAGELRQDRDGRIVHPEGWRAPEWPEDYTVENVARLVKVAKLRGSKIDDALRNAIPIQRALPLELLYVDTVQLRLDSAKRKDDLWEEIHASVR